VEETAELVDIVTHDQNVRAKLIQGQRERLARLEREGREPFLLQMLEQLR
jgi:hypothetical protein